MKILFLINSIPPDYGGGYLRVFRTASRFKKYGSFYKIATFTKRNSYQRDVQGITKYDVIFLKDGMLCNWLELPWLMLRHFKEYDVLYIASATRYTVLPSFVAKLLKKTVVNSVTLSMVDSPALPADKIYKIPYYWFKNTQFKIADYIFVNSPLLVEECINCGIKKERVKLINNPVDTKRFHPVSYKNRVRIRTENGMPGDNLTILFVGSINKRKGCDILPLLFETLFSKLSTKVTFIMCGQIGYPETEGIIGELETLFVQYGNVFIMKEEVENPSPFYQMSDIFLFPTTNEGMPNVVLEAMASGCMVLCNTLPGITDYVLDQEFLIKDNCIEEFVEKIIDYYNNPEKYVKAIDKNIKIIENKFSIANVDDSINKSLSDKQ